MFPQKNRLSRESFPTPQRKGFRVFSPFFSIVFYQTEEEEGHASIVVSKKVAKHAVVRNTLRRRFYSMLRPYFSKLITKTTVVVYPKTDSLKISFSVLEGEIEKAFKQAKLIK